MTEQFDKSTLTLNVVESYRGLGRSNVVCQQGEITAKKFSDNTVVVER